MLSIGDIKNTFLRRFLLIILSPIVILVAIVLCMLDGLSEVVKEVPEAILSSWKGK